MTRFECMQRLAALLKDELVVKRGRLKVPDAPGTGIRWNEKAIARHAI